MVAVKGNFEITNFKKMAAPGLSSAAFRRMKDAALGTDYSLSLVFIDAKKMQTLNREHRGKDYPTDILSFQLDKNAGEIFICPTATRKKAEEFDRTYSNYLAFLFIHGLIHLKGFDHGVTMEKQEKVLRKKFGI